MSHFLPRPAALPPLPGLTTPSLLLLSSTTTSFELEEREYLLRDKRLINEENGAHKNQLPLERDFPPKIAFSILQEAESQDHALLRPGYSPAGLDFCNW